MLPEDSKARHAALFERLRQTNVTEHFAEAKPEDNLLAVYSPFAPSSTRHSRI
jgi:hypothetical protein